MATTYFILFYKTVNDYVDKRQIYREEHLALAQDAMNQGALILAGALDHPPDEAVFVFKTDNSETVEAFAKKDPYVINGLIKEWRVRPWKVVVGD